MLKFKNSTRYDLFQNNAKNIILEWDLNEYWDNARIDQF